MRGAPTDGDDNAAARQPADVLDAWIKGLLGEVQGVQAKRLAQLCAQLQVEFFQWDQAQLAQALADLNFAGRQFAFGPLQRSWLARLVGRHRAAYERFIASHSRMVHCASQVQGQAAGADSDHERRASAARRALDELEAQRRALNAAIDEAVNWLQDMCTQLAGARADGSDDAKLETLAESAQFHTQALKRLQAAGTMVHDIVVRGASVLDRRAALLEQVRAGLHEFDSHWTLRLERLVADLRANRSAFPAAPKAIEAHNDFMKRLAAGVDACGALQHEERLLGDGLAMLREQLDDSRHDGP